MYDVTVPRKPSKKALAMVTTIAVIVAVSLLVWQIFRPKIGHATVAEIEAAMPPEFRFHQKLDEQAIRRMDQVRGLAVKGPHHEPVLERLGYRRFTYSKSTPSAQWVMLLDDRTSPAMEVAISERLFHDKDSQFSNLAALLRQGDLQYRPSVGRYKNQLGIMELRYLVTALGKSSTAFVAVGKTQQGADVLSLAADLSTKIYRAGGDLVAYRDALSLLMASDWAIRETVRLPNCPPELCRQLLQKLEPLPDQDQALKVALVEDFRETKLPALMDVHKLTKWISEVNGYLRDMKSQESLESYEGYGTFDPVATARILGSRFLSDVKCFGEPANSLDMVPPGRPYVPAPPKYGGYGMERGWKLTWEKLKFHYAMSTTENSLGLCMLKPNDYNDLYLVLRYRAAWLALREQTRILIATVLYRSEHAGALPKRLLDLAPRYLPSIPTDPFTGKEIQYSQAKSQIWCQPDLSFGPNDPASVADFCDLSNFKVSLAVTPK